MRARWLMPILVAVVWTEGAAAQAVPGPYPYPKNYPPGLKHSAPGLCDPPAQHACIPDKCFEVVRDVINGPNCGKIYSGFPLAGLAEMYTDVGYQQYGGPLVFLGCVPSPDTCQVHILGVGQTNPTEDACGMPRPGCYFALSQKGSTMVDASAACATANSGSTQTNGALKLLDPQDRQCIADMVTAGQQNTQNPKKLACHSWGTVFCDHNGFFDAEYYGGLCPPGATCVHNHGDRLACALYSCAINSASPATAFGSWAKSWENPNWGNSPQWVPPDREHCLGNTESSTKSSLGNLGDRHSFSEYLRERDANGSGYTPGLNKTSRTSTSVCPTTHDHGKPARGAPTGEAP